MTITLTTSQYVTVNNYYLSGHTSDRYSKNILHNDSTSLNNFDDEEVLEALGEQLTVLNRDLSELRVALQDSLSKIEKMEALNG